MAMSTTGAIGGTPNLALLPAGAPPPGQMPNLYNHPPSRQGVVIGVCSLFFVLTTFFVTIRLYTTTRITRSVSAEDYLSAFSALVAFAYMAFLIHLSYVARHMWDTPAIWLFGSDKYWQLRLTQNLLNPLGFFFSRIPIFMLYLRLFGQVTWFRYASWAGMISAFVIYVHTVPVVAAFCVPRNGDPWASLPTFARCSRAEPDALAQGAGNITLDLYLLLLPLPIIWGLHMPLKKKIGVAAIFATGSIALIVSCISFYYRYRLAHSLDADWEEAAYDACSAAEINIAIICGCMPAFAAFFKKRIENGSLLTSLRSALGFRSSTDRSSQQIYKNGAPKEIGQTPEALPSDSSQTHLKEQKYIKLEERSGHLSA